MRIGVMSDTHNHLANVRAIVALLNAARVERVVHTGDITQAKTLDALAGLEAPLFGVFGNNDLERPALDAAIARHGFH
ncbi:MAG TPA: metallophosphoesterase family protein, partial [Myxococcota bacterium]|nr:metallophosphoesterase family protein [Myxococcota bacterium]